MRKLSYAGAVVASGFVLFGASPAQADPLPGTGTAEQQADEQLTDSRPVLQFDARQNFPDLNPLLPDGGQSSALQPTTARQSELFDGGLPLLGGLGGLLPVNDLPPPAADGTTSDTTGLPAGGVAVLPGVTLPPAADQASSAATEPAQQEPTPAATPDDPRLREEPIDEEAGHRQFSPNGRPVAGIDQQYK